MIDSSKQESLSRYAAWLLLAFTILSIAAIRFHLLAIPLERDEGEYAYGAQLLLQGLAPYVHLYTMKLPGIFAIYATVISLFGQSAWGVHVGLLIVNACTTLICYLLGRQVISRTAGIGAALCFATLSLMPAVHGIFANTEHFVLPPALLGLLFLLRGLDKNRDWRLLGISGLLLGVAICVKQPAAAFVLCGVVVLMLPLTAGKNVQFKTRVGALLIYTGGAAIPLLITGSIFVMAGAFKDLWFWTVDYARAYAGVVPWAEGLQTFMYQTGLIVNSAPLLWLGVAAGLIFCPVVRLNRINLVFFLSFLFFSFLAVCPGLYFRPHYFILLLPAAALAFGLCLEIISRMLVKLNLPGAVPVGIALLIALAASALSLHQQRAPLFFMTPEQLSREIYWPNPFVESVEIGRIIREHTDGQDTIAVLGSEPQLFFYSGRKSATGYIYMYPLMEQHALARQMQMNMIQQLEKQKPKILIFIRNRFSWQWTQQSHTILLDWYGQYSKAHYTRLGMVDIFSDATEYHWRPDVVWPPQSVFWIEIMERKDDGTIRPNG
jgi:hypothetical protein